MGRLLAATAARDRAASRPLRVLETEFVAQVAAGRSENGGGSKGRLWVGFGEEKREYSDSNKALKVRLPAGRVAAPHRRRSLNDNDRWLAVFCWPPKGGQVGAACRNSGEQGTQKAALDQTECRTNTCRRRLGKRLLWNGMKSVEPIQGKVQTGPEIQTRTMRLRLRLTRGTPIAEQSSRHSLAEPQHRR
jgi:hypothetical protein